MRSAVITDIHFGIRKNSKHFSDNITRFLRDVFFPTLDKEGIKHIINVGDLFDDRKKIDTSIIEIARDEYYSQLRKRGIKEDLVIGNHDIYMRESNDINSPTEVFRDSIDDGTLTVHSSVVQRGSILFVPWINKTNQEESLRLIRESTARFCFGHLELVGFHLYKGQVCTKGHDSAPFDKFELTCSGHFHIKSRQRNIVYLGSPSQHNWQDCGDTRGFHLFDHDTGDLEFIRNPYNMFDTLRYENAPITEQQLEQCSGRYIRVFYDEITKESQFKRFREQIEDVAIELKTIKVASVVQDGEVVALIQGDVEIEDTMTMIQSECNGDIALFEAMSDLHNRAQMISRV